MKKISVLYLIIIPIMLHAQDFDWQGHRGARGLLPENSLPAFKKALELGVRTLEMDVVISKDLQVVVSHDPWFSAEICLNPEGKPISNEEQTRLSLYQLTYAEILSFDCGSLGNPHFDRQEKLPVHKPLLSDVFKMAEKYCKDEMRDEIYYNIEIKSSPEWDQIFHPEIPLFCDLVYQTIDEYVPWKRVTIQSFDFRVLRYFHEKYPDVRLSALEESETDPEKVMEMIGFIPDIYSPYYKLLKSRRVDWLHEKGIRVIPWTVNDRKEMQELIQMGVDGIITDYPDLIGQFNTE